MKYSKYFKEVLHNDGLPQLNAKEWARMMNIAALEYGNNPTGKSQGNEPKQPRTL